ncbi:ribonuclease H-like domain-containing protein [Halovivax sp.]|uniref:ribonuclease H-like domain-containing protein n=1 Tax=Halovivax sp. TaxID=1935978 RepID=UPI0025BBC76E|nr:ribonuclease H-like domain-containing protein [Halovivax sp.]
MRIENSFIPVRGVGETTERRLWAEGVTHWDDFDGRVVGPAVADRIERFIETGRERIDRGDYAYFAETLPSGSRWRLYENVADDACYLDIETTGLDASRDVVTTVSVHRAGETTTFVREDDLSVDALTGALEGASLLVTFNGRRFDVPFLETRFDLELTVPHLDLMYPCRTIGLTGGLKRIERDLDIDRDTPDITGRDAVRLWHEYERGDDEALETLIRYNRADTVNLERLATEVTDRLHDEVFESVCDGPITE